MRHVRSERRTSFPRDLSKDRSTTLRLLAEFAFDSSIVTAAESDSSDFEFAQRSSGRRSLVLSRFAAARAESRHRSTRSVFNDADVEQRRAERSKQSPAATDATGETNAIVQRTFANEIDDVERNADFAVARRTSKTNGRENVADLPSSPH